MKTVAMILALVGLVLAWQSTVLGLGAADAAVQAPVAACPPSGISPF